jgi:hypothetical protein
MVLFGRSLCPFLTVWFSECLSAFVCHRWAVIDLAEFGGKVLPFGRFFSKMHISALWGPCHKKVSSREFSGSNFDLKQPEGLSETQLDFRSIHLVYLSVQQNRSKQITLIVHTTSKTCASTFSVLIISAASTSSGCFISLLLSMTF